MLTQLISALGLGQDAPAKQGSTKNASDGEFAGVFADMPEEGDMQPKADDSPDMPDGDISEAISPPDDDSSVASEQELEASLEEWLTSLRQARRAANAPAGEMLADETGHPPVKEKGEPDRRHYELPETMIRDAVRSGSGETRVAGVPNTPAGTKTPIEGENSSPPAMREIPVLKVKELTPWTANPDKPVRSAVQAGASENVLMVEQGRLPVKGATQADIQTLAPASGGGAPLSGTGSPDISAMKAEAATLKTAAQRDSGTALLGGDMPASREVQTMPEAASGPTQGQSQAQGLSSSAPPSGTTPDITMRPTLRTDHTVQRSEKKAEQIEADTMDIFDVRLRDSAPVAASNSPNATTAAMSAPQIVLTASQVLPEEMRNPRPARGETSDHFDIGLGTIATEARLSGQVSSSPGMPLQGARIDSVGVARQVADALPRLADGSIDIRLEPEELGRVRLHMVTGEGNMVVHVQTDRPETLDLLRRHIDMLARDLANAGYEGASFDFGDSQQQSPQDNAPMSTQAPAEDTSHPRAPELAHAGGLDIRI